MGFPQVLPGLLGWGGRELFFYAKGVGLLLGIAFLHAEGDAFEPEAEGLPVDEENDFQGHQGECQGEAGKVPTGEFGAFASERADEDALIALVFVDTYLETISGVSKIEVKGEVEWREGGDVVVF